MVNNSNDCRSILTLISSNGTNVMKNKKRTNSINCVKIKGETQSSITSCFNEISQVTSLFLKILHAAVKMCVLHSRPFNMTHAKRF